MSDELKPCPFCKWPAALVEGDGPFIGRCQVECTHCRIATYWYDEAVVVAQWNRRAQPAEEVQKLRQALEAIRAYKVKGAWGAAEVQINDIRLIAANALAKVTP